MLTRFDERAPTYDRENAFFTEDFEDLRAAGYFTASLPTEYGGAGLNLALGAARFLPRMASGVDRTIRSLSFLALIPTVEDATRRFERSAKRIGSRKNSVLQPAQQLFYLYGANLCFCDGKR